MSEDRLNSLATLANELKYTKICFDEGIDKFAEDKA